MILNLEPRGIRAVAFKRMPSFGRFKPGVSVWVGETTQTGCYCAVGGMLNNNRLQGIRQRETT